MSYFFYSDPHFGHQNILEYAARPFKSIQEHDQELIKLYRDVTTPEDTVIWCGDAFLTNRAYSAHIMSQLSGQKILVRGNHDRAPGAMASLGFDVVVDSLTMHISGQEVLVSHYPYSGLLVAGQWFEDAEGTTERSSKGIKYPLKRKDCALIHGHTHSPDKVNKTAIHVGVDAWEFRPVPMTAIVELVEQMYA